MCKVCGCSEGNSRVSGLALQPVRTHVAGLSPSRMVSIEQDILSKNDSYAKENRDRLARNKVFAVNLMSGPGAGKTSLLVKTLSDLQGSIPMCVIEGDQETSNDTDRIRATGASAIQINTGKGCHLDAHMVGHALDKLNIALGSTLFIENVGNLVCPSGFDLGERQRVAILSVTEGDDKPLKYPDMFAFANVLLLSKIDLLPYVDFNMDQCIEYARRINPSISVIPVSVKSGEGMEQWYGWLRSHNNDATSTVV